MAKLITESRTKPSGVLYSVINTSTLDTLPVLGIDNGDGTSTLKVDTELTATIDPTGLATSAKQDTIKTAIDSVTAKIIAAPATEAKQPALEGTDKSKVSLYVKKTSNADTVLTLGKTDDANSLPVALSTEALAALETITFTIPSENLGQQHKAASLSVAPADDIADATYIGDIKFGESAPLDVSFSTGDTDSKTIRVRLSNEDLTALETISLTGSLPDTSASDLSHIHSNADSIKTAVEVLDNCINGNEAQVDVVTLPVSFNAGANDATTQRVTLSTETLSALENVTIDASALPTGKELASSVLPKVNTVSALLVFLYAHL